MSQSRSKKRENFTSTPRPDQRTLLSTKPRFQPIAGRAFAPPTASPPFLSVVCLFVVVCSSGSLHACGHDSPLSGHLTLGSPLRLNTSRGLFLCLLHAPASGFFRKIAAHEAGALSASPVVVVSLLQPFRPPTAGPGKTLLKRQHVDTLPQQAPFILPYQAICTRNQHRLVATCTASHRLSLPVRWLQGVAAPRGKKSPQGRKRNPNRYF